MKNTYIALYVLSFLIFIFTLSGGSLTRPVFESLSEKTIEKTGFKKSYVQSFDSRIDDMIFKSKQIELQIEKIKNFFSSDKIDESKYSKEESKMLENSVYVPLKNMLIMVYRFLTVVLSVFILFTAVIIQLFSRGIELRKRVARLEAALYSGNRA
ncbi:MAG TPA: hypothetical protein PL089_09835 [Ignavibacteria bacterium]|nr:hypothetical protein [Ignavibacteria bacterium]